MIGIYKITSPTGRIYIGQSWDIEKRFLAYKKGVGAVNSPALNQSFKKHGIKNHVFEIINKMPVESTQKELDDAEVKLIERYKFSGCRMLNIRDGGSHGKHSNESKKKVSDSKKGIATTIWTPESLAKRSASQKGLKRTELTKKRLSESKLGEKNPSYHKTPDFAKITHDQVREIRAYPKPLEKGMLTILAERYGVSRACISGIRSFVNFKHVE